MDHGLYINLDQKLKLSIDTNEQIKEFVHDELYVKY